MAKKQKQMSRAAHREDAAKVQESEKSVEESARKSVLLFVVLLAALAAYGIYLVVHNAQRKAQQAADAAAYGSLDAAFMPSWLDAAQQSSTDEEATADKAKKRDQLNATIAAHPGSHAAMTAEFYLATMLFEDKSYADAATAFSAFVSKHGQAMPELAGWARLGEANALAEQGKFAEAMPKYEDAANPMLLGSGATSLPYAQLLGASCALELGDAAKATALLDQVLTGGDTGTTAVETQARLLRSRIDLFGAQLAIADDAGDAASDATPAPDTRPALDESIESIEVHPAHGDHGHEH